jgi:hypothetical protein
MKLKAKVAKLSKALKALKKFLMNALGKLSHNHSPVREGEDDAMFTKRPYLGNSCASCDKDIFDLMGNKASFSAW